MTWTEEKFYPASGTCVYQDKVYSELTTYNYFCILHAHSYSHNNVIISHWSLPLYSSSHQQIGQIIFVVVISSLFKTGVPYTEHVSTKVNTYSKYIHWFDYLRTCNIFVSMFAISYAWVFCSFYPFNWIIFQTVLTL